MSRPTNLIPTLLVLLVTVSLSFGQIIHTIINSSYTEDTPGFYGWDSREEIDLLRCHEPRYPYNRLLYGERQPGDIIYENSCFWSLYDQNIYNVTFREKHYVITFVNLTITTKDDVPPSLEIIDGGVGFNHMLIKVGGPANAGVIGYDRVFATRDDMYVEQ